ncbi:MAG: hypothetical protein WD673_09750 [Alphaproteobacteria bacterium]
MTARHDRRASRAPSGPPGWAITLTDLGFLILAFFVVQLSMATPRPAAWLEFSRAVSRQLVPSPDATRTGPTADANVPLHDELFALDTGYLVALAEETVMPVLAPLGAVLREERRGLTITLPSSPAGSGGSWVQGEARAALATMGQAFRFVDNRIDIVAIVAPRDAADAPSALAAGLAASEAVAESLRAGGYGRPLAILGTLAAADADRLDAIEIRVRDTGEATR